MVALEGDKFMKGIMVAAGATLDGGVWEPHFVPSTVKMASPEYHGLLAHGDSADWHGFRHAGGRRAQPQLCHDTNLAQ